MRKLDNLNVFRSSLSLALILYVAKNLPRSRERGRKRHPISRHSPELDHIFLPSSLGEGLGWFCGVKKSNGNCRLRHSFSLPPPFSLHICHLLITCYSPSGIFSCLSGRVSHFLPWPRGKRGSFLSLMVLLFVAFLSLSLFGCGHPGSVSSRGSH